MGGLGFSVETTARTCSLCDTTTRSRAATASAGAANLRCALTSRAVIDQAKGILMARLGVDAEGAFARLVTVSNRLNVKVRALAQLVVDGHADHLLAAARVDPCPGGRPARD